jgi:ABC-type proline/glycine betaine transport system substrate-binding protein
MKTPPMRSRVRRVALLVGLMLCGIVTLTAPAYAAPYCAHGKPVVLAGVNWDSGEFITEVMREI